jgi:hypothetical protein
MNLRRRELTVTDIAAYGYPRFYTDLFEYWKNGPAVPEIPSELRAVQADVTWEELFTKFAGNQFTQFILRRMWERLDGK